MYNKFLVLARRLRKNTPWLYWTVISAICGAIGHLQRYNLPLSVARRANVGKAERRILHCSRCSPKLLGVNLLIQR